MSRARAVAAMLLAGLLAACASSSPPPATAPAAPATVPRAAPAVRDPAVLDIVGSAYLVRTKTDVAPPAQPFLDLWIKSAGLDLDDPKLVYGVTGDGGGESLFCRAGPPLDPAQLQAQLAGFSVTDPAYAATRYALTNPAYLYDATLALITERPDQAVREACRRSGIAYRDFTLGLLRCDRGICPVVLLIKENRLAANPTAQRMLRNLAAPDGLLADPVALAEAGMLPLKPADRARIQAALAALVDRTS